MRSTKIVFSVIAAVAALLVLFVLLSTFTVIGAGERGVSLTWGAYNGEVLEPGLHWLVPVAQSVVKMDVKTAKLELSQSEAYSHDLQIVDIDSVLNYNVDPSHVGDVYKDIGLDYEDKIIRPNLEAAIKQTIAKYTAEQLLAERGLVQDEIEQAIKKGLEPAHVVVTKYALVNEAFSSDYEAAIERKQIAEQDALAAKNKLDQVKYEADQRVAQAQAEAQAIKIQADAIRAQGGAEYVQLQAIKQWDGHLPQQMIPGSTVPFINLK